jgi:hypothetical protein
MIVSPNADQLDRMAVRALEGWQVMSFILKLIIFGWLATILMVVVCALDESGKLLKMRRRVAAWIEVWIDKPARAEEAVGQDDQEAA